MLPPRPSHFRGGFISKMFVSPLSGLFASSPGFLNSALCVVDNEEV